MKNIKFVSYLNKLLVIICSLLFLKILGGMEKLTFHVDYMMQDNKMAEIVEDVNFLIVRRGSMLADFIAAYETPEFRLVSVDTSLQYCIWLT